MTLGKTIVFDIFPAEQGGGYFYDFTRTWSLGYATSEAQALYERAIGLEPQVFEAHFNLGNIFHDLGRYNEAQSCYREAIRLNPTYAEAHFYLAVTLEKGGRSAEARAHWRAYQQLAPTGEWVHLAKEFLE